MHHLRQLEDCQLLITEKEGRHRRLYHTPVPIQMIYDRWTTEYSGFWASKLADVKYAVEQRAARRTAVSEGGDPGKKRGRVA